MTMACPKWHGIGTCRFCTRPAKETAPDQETSGPVQSNENSCELVFANVCRMPLFPSVPAPPVARRVLRSQPKIYSAAIVLDPAVGGLAFLSPHVAGLLQVECGQVSSERR